MPRRRNYITHTYSSSTGWNARRWSSDPMERRAALLRDQRAERRLADERRKKSTEEARRRRYRRSGIRVVKPRYYSGYNYPVMRTPMMFLIFITFLPLIIFAINFIFVIKPSNLTVILTIIGVIISSFIILSTVIVILYRKKTNTIKKAILEEPSEIIETPEEEQKEIFCTFCGNPIKKSSKRCKFCDAKLTE